MNSLVLIETDMSQFNGETFKEVTAFYSELLIMFKVRRLIMDRRWLCPMGRHPFCSVFLRHFMSKVEGSLGNSSRR